MLTRTLFPLSDNPSEIIAFLERNFILENGEPIRFEPWQKQHVLSPVFERGKHGWNTFLIGLPKKNGKSTQAASIVVYGLLLDDANPEIYSAAGDLDQARIIFDFTAKALRRSRLSKHFRFYRDAIERADGAGVYRALAADATGNHGLNPSVVIFDELWNQSDYSLIEALTHSPTRKHPFLFIVTYSGYQARTGNPLWDFYQRGVTNSDPHQYTFWRSGPDANLASWITPEYLESQRRRLPDHIFRRLHFNEWSVAADSKAFRIPEECWSGTFQDALRGSTYVVGLDLAKLHDFTSWSVLRTEVDPIRLVDCGTLPHMDYSAQADLLAAKIQRFGNPPVLCDATGPGAAVVEMLRERGIAVDSFTFTSESKAKVVTDLCVAFEQRQIALPKNGRTIDESRSVADLEAQLFNFEPTVLRSGGIRYEGGAGYHDDAVISLCLAWALALESRVQPWAQCISVPAGPSALVQPSLAQPAVSMGPPRRIPLQDLDPSDDGPPRWWSNF